MNSKELKIARKNLALENKKWPIIPIRMPRHQWPYDDADNRVAVWRCKFYLIQEFDESTADGGIKDVIRLSINRTLLNDDGMWRDDISWDDLQWIKNCIGYGDRFAVEIYPAEHEVVNVANMRHLWVLPYPPSYVWRKK